MVVKDDNSDASCSVHPYDECSRHKRDVMEDGDNAQTIKYTVGNFFRSGKTPPCNDKYSTEDQVFHDTIGSEDSSQATGYTHEFVTGPNVACWDPLNTRLSTSDTNQEGSRDAPCGPGGVVMCGPKMMTQCEERQAQARKDNDALDFVFGIVESTMCGEGATVIDSPSKGQKSKKENARPTELSEKAIFLLRSNSIMEKSIKSVKSDSSHIGTLRNQWSEEDEEPYKRTSSKANKTYRDTSLNTNNVYRDSSLKTTNIYRDSSLKTNNVYRENDSAASNSTKSSTSTTTTSTEESQKQQETLVLSAAVAARVEREIDDARKRMLSASEEVEKVECRDDTSVSTCGKEGLGLLATVDVETNVATVKRTADDTDGIEKSKCGNTAATSAVSLSEGSASPHCTRELVVFSESSISSIDNDNLFPTQVEGGSVSANDDGKQQLWAEIVEFSSRLYKELSGETSGERIPVAKGFYFLACLVFFLFWPSNLKKEKKCEYPPVAARQPPAKKASLLDLVQES